MSRTARTYGIVFLILSLCLVAIRVYAADISGVTVVDLTSDSATIEWDTDIATDGTINYGLDSAVGTVRDPTTNKQHSLTLQNLDPSTTYHFRVVSTDDAGNTNATAGFVFTTKGSQSAKAIESIKKITDPKALVEVVDSIKSVAKDIILPPSIIGAPKVTVEENRARVTWKTDCESSSEVELVKDSEYSGSAKNPYSITQGNARENVKLHAVDVIGLDPSTTYHFRVFSQDSLGLTGVSEDDTFQTKSILPVITGVKVTRIQETSALISWSTGTILAKGNVSYTNGRTKAVKSAGNPVFLTQQKIQLTGLEFGTRYTGIVTATDQGGNNVESKPFTFVTVRDVIPPIITKVNNSSTLFPDDDAKVQTILSWTTDEPAFCQVFYTQGLVKKEGSDGDSLAPEGNPVTAHLQVIVGFTPGSVYKFWTKCHDEAQNDSQSDDFVLITPTKEQSIIDLILANFQGTFGWVGNINKK